MPSRPQFNMLNISQDDAVDAYIEPYKRLRLTSLQLNPEAYTSTYENESMFTNDIWEGRLKDPLASTIVAIQATTGAQQDLVGMVTLLGPVRTSPLKSVAATGPNERNHADYGDAPEYHIVSLFTAPSVRRLGLGENLVRSATDLAKDKGKMRHASAIRISVAVVSRNLRAKCLYEKCGFVVVEESDISMSAIRGEPVPAQPAVEQCRIAWNMEQYISLPQP
ncbi:MAG: hypothetical protein M1813_004355 [Trichoglossum hirsutum]|jgi:ribosomal protein S18 acetylase RimI-like enzyme|nr:MAG: hypothetical protein M1813_004355 [Trichoglossum hirsutum]